MALLSALTLSCNRTSRITTPPNDTVALKPGAVGGENAARVKFDEAEKHFLVHDFNRAIVAYNEVFMMGDTPYRKRSLSQIGHSLWQAGDGFHAELIFRRVIADFPGSLEAMSAAEMLPLTQILVTEEPSPSPSVVLGTVESEKLSISAWAPVVRPRDVVRGNLKVKASNLGGADAIVGVSYETDSSGSIVGKGTVVHFYPTSGAAARAQRQLAQLKKDYDAGLFTNAEYASKRQMILSQP